MLTFDGDIRQIIIHAFGASQGDSVLGAKPCSISAAGLKEKIDSPPRTGKGPHWTVVGDHEG